MHTQTNLGRRTALVAAGLAVAATLFANIGTADAWSLEEAAAPYKGTTIRTIGEALPPLEAMDKLKSKFEDGRRLIGSRSALN